METMLTKLEADLHHIGSLFDGEDYHSLGPRDRTIVEFLAKNLIVDYWTSGTNVTTVCWNKPRKTK
jgi:hypothetical protein